MIEQKRQFIEALFGQSLAESDFFSFSVILLLNFFVIFVPFAISYSYIQSKLTADLQARIGYDQVGPSGVFQFFSDSLKLFFKGSRISARSDLVWTWFVSALLLSLVVFIPMSSFTVIFDSDLSTLTVMLFFVILSYLLLNLSLGQRFPDQWLGGFRAFSQTLAGVVAGAFALLTNGIFIGGFSWMEIHSAQGFWPFEWSIFLYPPIMILSFAVFFMSGLVFLNLPPFDNALSMQRLRGAVSVKKSGLDLGTFYLNRFFSLFVWSLFSVIVFLGGWHIPESIYEYFFENNYFGWIVVLQSIVLILKALLLMTVYLLIQKTLPKLTTRLTLGYSLWFLIPVGFGMFFAAVVVKMVVLS